MTIFSFFILSQVKIQFHFPLKTLFKVLWLVQLIKHISRFRHGPNSCQKCVNLLSVNLPWSLESMNAFSSVQFSRSVVSDSLRPDGLQHARPPCPSSTPGVYSNSCPLSQWCHPTISSSVVPFSSRLQSFPAPGSFQMRQLFARGGQSIGLSALASVLPMNTQDWSPFEWTDWNSLQSKGLSVSI